VDPSIGTKATGFAAAVKLTPFHSKKDYEFYRKNQHRLSLDSAIEKTIENRQNDCTEAHATSIRSRDEIIEFLSDKRQIELVG
jgi:valyl-tRNA synthetase